jgi:hypothetical protein
VRRSKFKQTRYLTVRTCVPTVSEKLLLKVCATGLVLSMTVTVKVLSPLNEAFGVPQTLTGVPQVEPLTSNVSHAGKLLADH